MKRKPNSPQPVDALVKKTDWRALAPEATPERRAQLQEYAERYQSYAGFFRKFTGSVVERCADHPEGCYLADTPCVADIRDIYGRERAFSWLQTLITYACNCLGRAFVSGSDTAMRAYLAHLTASCAYLKASEILLFFQRLAAGSYGRIYGDITPDYLTEAMRQFLRQRNAELDLYQRRLDEKVRTQLRREGTVTYEQYRRMLEAGFLGDPQLRDIHCNTSCHHYASGTCPYDKYTQCPRYKDDTKE